MNKLFTHSFSISVCAAFALLANSASAGLVMYPFSVDFGSQQVCENIAKGIDASPGQGDWTHQVQARCENGTLKASVSSLPDTKGVSLRVVWTGSNDQDCTKTMEQFKKAHVTASFTCEVVNQWLALVLNKWVATFDLSLTSGTGVDDLQQQKIKTLREERDRRDLTEDAATLSDVHGHGKPAQPTQSDNPSSAPAQHAGRVLQNP